MRFWMTELSRQGRSTTDLLATLKELEARRVSLVALNGMTFDLTTTPWAHDGELAGRHRRVRARADGGAHPLGHRCRQGTGCAARPPSRAAAKVGSSYPGWFSPSSPRAGAIGWGREVGLSKNTDAEIVERNRAP